MGNNFQWQTDTEFDPPPGSTKPQRSWEMIGFWLVTAVIILFLAGGWFLSQRRLAQVDSEIRADLQTLLDLQHTAFLTGDGDLFFSTHASDPGWQAAQLLPFNQAAQQAGLTITRVETNQEKVWASATWTQNDETYQKLLFFEGRGSRYQQIPGDAAYWGELEARQAEWGTLYTYEVDEDWTLDIITFVAQQCQQQCQSLTLLVSDSLSEIALRHAVQIPSPRIFALDTSGQPADAYWDLLEKRLTAYLNPATIRIALPPKNFLNLNTIDYEAAATQFMAENPDIRVELVTLADLPTNPQELAGFDGAAFPPSAQMIASGTVYDLTPLLESDITFDKGDFYQQLWQGAWWRERLWFMPQAATMRLLFYNKQLYRDAGLAEPSLHWTWTEMNEDLQALQEAVTAVNSALHYTVFLDAGRDSLFAYAYNWQADCAETAVIRCQTALTPAHINAALAWNQQLTASGLAPARSKDDQARWNWQAAVRVEEPVYYEHFLQLSSMGVVPFPGSDQFDGMTPLWLEGSFITQHSQNPLAVWRWLKFLSYQPPLPSYRLIPARPSVAQQTAYWQTLPRPLNEAMRSAFPFSRPVTIEDDLWFDDDVETAVPPPQRPTLNWFTP
ncbi:MAG: extracellular solute-binding protein [Anaerolineae bacterium]|nr:extracellular solute-binding protein [Anaerolineae bacterium]